jgi:hypothetical protein
VEVFFDSADVDPDTHHLRMWRFSDDRQWLVRGGVDIAPGVAALDWECPFQTQALYRAELFAADGTSIGWTESSTVTLDVNDVWVHNPLVPTTAVALGEFALLDGTASRNVRPTVGQVVYGEDDVVGRWIGTRRRGVTDMPFGLAVESVEDADALQAMLGDHLVRRLGVLCIRTPPPVRIPRTLFAAVQEPDERDVNVRWGGSRTDLVFTATEVKPPFEGITTPLLTYDDLDAAFATYTERDAAFATYTEMDRAYEYAGLAS